MQPSTSRGYAHLCVVYLVWGSVYLAVKLAIAQPGGFAVFQLQAMRLGLGAATLALIPLLRGTFKVQSWRDLRICVICGLLFWVGGNGLAVIALMDLASGFVAMALATIPLWTVMFEAVFDRKVPRPAQFLALLLGFFGLAMIVVPVLEGQGSDVPPVTAVLAVIAAPVSWVAASLTQRQIAGRMDSMVAASLQLGVGAAGSLILLLLLGQTEFPDAAPVSVAAMFYLAFVGSALGFRSYLLALRALPSYVVATFAYVNPVVSVALGWLVLGETLSWLSLAGMAIILGSVALVLSQTRQG